MNPLIETFSRANNDSGSPNGEWTKEEAEPARTLQEAAVPPVLKINYHATGGRRTKDILGGPKSLETEKFGLSKG